MIGLTQSTGTQMALQCATPDASALSGCSCVSTLEFFSEMQDYTSRFSTSVGMAAANATKSMTTSWMI